MDFLKRKREQISEFIKDKGRFSLSILNMLFEPQLPDYGDLLRSLHKSPEKSTVPNIITLNNIELLDIDAPSLPVETETNIIPVYFLVKLRFYVTVEKTYSPFATYFEKKISLQGMENVPFDWSSQREKSEEFVVGTFPIYANLITENGVYMNLELKQI